MASSPIPFRRRSRRIRTLALAAALAGGATLAAVAPSAPVAAAPCPAAYPVADLTVGQAASGLTVERGTAPDPFDVTVIGVIPDGILPGVDLIVVETSSPAIDRAGGIWAGMSGSPVYAEDGRLIGAVAYGLSFAPSPIGGVTPAEAMYDLLDTPPAAVPAPTVDLPAAIERRVVATGEATAAQAAAGLRPLPVPLGASGAVSRSDALAEKLRERHPNAIVHAGAAAEPGPAAVSLEAGGNVAVASTYGDITFAGIGTVTAVCGAEALLFGHPFFAIGSTTQSAHEATALYVQPDPVFGSYKVANPGGIAGTVDEDRIAGLHTALGTSPPAGSIVTTLDDVQSGAFRTGTTFVVDPTANGIAALYHVAFNIIRVGDREGPGVVEYDWSVSGRRANGSPWELRRRDIVASQFDSAVEAAFAVADPIWMLQDNEFEAITIDRVRLTGTVDDRYTAATIVGLQVRGGGVWRTLEPDATIRAVAGSTLRVRAVLRRYRSTRIAYVPLSFTVPAGWRGAIGMLQVRGSDFGFFGEEASAAEAGTFGELLAELAAAPAGDTVTGTLDLERETETGSRSLHREARAQAPAVVQGEQSFPVEVVAAPAARPGVVSAGRDWAVRSSLSSGAPTRTLRFGETTDVAVMGDWNGDGRATPGQFRAGQWLLRNSFTSTTTRAVTFGAAGDLPVVGDWDGDGDDDLGVYRAGGFRLRDSTTSGPPTAAFRFGGAAGAQPVAGDWDGDGDDTVGTFAAGRWQVRNTLTAGPASRTATFGRAGDRAVAGDWDGDGRTGIGVVRAGRWLLRQGVSTGTTHLRFGFGATTARPVVWR